MSDPKSYVDRNVLITGGLGFIGSSLAVKLAGEGANVTVIDNLNPAYGGNVFNIRDAKDRVTVVLDDMRKTDVMATLVEKADVVFHMAAQVSYIDSLKIPYEDLDLNTRATLILLECCKKYNRKAKIIYSSSRMVYGKAEKVPINEQCACQPISMYGIHKLTSESYLHLYYREYGIPIVIFRLTNPYGPRQQVKHSKYSLVGWFIRQAMEGKTIKIFGDGAQLRDYIYIDDIVDGMMQCTVAGGAVGNVINVGSGVSTRFCDMVKAVLDRVQSGSMEFVPWPDNYERIETGDISVDISKILSMTTWKPHVSLEEGIRKTCEYYRMYLDKYIP